MWSETRSTSCPVAAPWGLHFTGFGTVESMSVLTSPERTVGCSTDWDLLLKFLRIKLQHDDVGLGGRALVPGRGRGARAGHAAVRPDA
ncbi:hypothetical protein EVAR_51486_1 [Eumeta japonica]|uniref:Uncharacterized protein n=1 Tax=Eumeta variegata TaxID=151549 RepID=A0A4C1XCJ1_EUMVA|nr:hypothetical protein EVAR_51486_1 [Eumeta japonica]